jgi:hypothetical protein
MLDFTQAVNTGLMFGWLGSVFLIGLTVMLFIGFYYSTADAKKSFGASMFLCFLFCVMLRALELVPDLALFISLALAAVGVAAIMKSD